MKFQEELEKFRDGLLQQRDELRVQLNLAKLEKAKLEEVSGEAIEASEDVWASIKMLGEEIERAYKRIKSRLCHAYSFPRFLLSTP